MSEMVIVEEGELFMFVEWSRSRKAMSPVPPAMSSIVQPFEGEEGVEEPGLMERTKWSLWWGVRLCLEGGVGKKRGRERERGTDFQRRWIPRDMQSFMVSYEAATLLKTPATSIQSISPAHKSSAIA